MALGWLGSWSEPSFVVPGLSTAGAVQLGREFGQAAIFEITQDELRVIDCANDQVRAQTGAAHELRLRGSRPTRGLDLVGLRPLSAPSAPAPGRSGLSASRVHQLTANADVDELDQALGALPGGLAAAGRS